MYAEIVSGFSWAACNERAGLLQEWTMFCGHCGGWMAQMLVAVVERVALRLA
jgi:hypothetical protein